ncbi:MAG: HAD-IC family P-type ATPase, partial [Nanoarchaeota archaeon]
MSSHAEKEGELFSKLESNLKGLSAEGAKKNLETYGKNEITQKKKISPWQIFFEQFNNFLVYILIIASIVSVIIGFVQNDTDSYIDAGAIFAIVILNAILGFVQEYRAETSLDALKKLMTQKVTVIRDGRLTSVDSREVVPGDIMIIEAGDKIAADGRVIEQIGLKIQESSLTGESTSVGKKPEILPENTQLADRTNMVFSGTTAVVGKGTILITSTGMQTELGKIANLIQEAKVEPTPLQKRLEDLGKMLGILTIFICIVVFIIGSLRSGDWVGMFLVGISLAVAAVPEGLPAVITISLALGMQRMIKRNALIRKLPSVEALGSVTVICSDKTGTLTKNEMTVRKVFFDGKIIDIEGAGYSPSHLVQVKDSLIFKVGLLCNNAELYKEGGQWKIHGDPTEAALLTSAVKAGIKIDDAKLKAKRVHEILFDSERKMMTTINQEGSKKIAYTKGAPNVVLQFCDRVYSGGKIKKLTANEKKKILDINEKMSS